MGEEALVSLDWSVGDPFPTLVQVHEAANVLDVVQAVAVFQ